MNFRPIFTVSSGWIFAGSRALERENRGFQVSQIQKDKRHPIWR
jgi:hypothetical protein